VLVISNSDIFSGQPIYLTPTFDPKKHQPVMPFVYDAPVKTAKPDYSIYENYLRHIYPPDVNSQLPSKP
jgi:hypothetical protein